MKRTGNYSTIMSYFSPKLRQSIEKISSEDLQNIQEIRLRASKPLGLVCYGRTKFLSRNGGITDTVGMALVANREDVEFSFKAVCDYSVHSYHRELAQGFITIQGGHRVGLCGTAIIRDEKIDSVKYITGLNFRLAGQVNGCADEIFNQCFGEKPSSILILGVPASGKTTILRELCRLAGSKYQVSVIDERGEIAASYHGQHQNNIGILTDVLDGYPKAEGISIALRVMAPQLIVCDEIGGKDDVQAIGNAVNSGVKVVATAHCETMEDALNKQYIGNMLQSRMFDFVAIIGSGNELGRIKRIIRVRDYDFEGSGDLLFGRNNESDRVLSLQGAF